MSEWDELKRKAETKKAEGFELVNNLPCDSILALIAQNQRLRNGVESDLAEVERMHSAYMVQWRNARKLRMELRELRDSMAFRTSMIGRLEAERDLLRSELDALRESIKSA